MADFPLNRDRRKSDPDSDSIQDYAGALRTIRGARGLFLLLLLLSLFLQIGVYCAARWTQVLEPAQVEIAAPAEGANHFSTDRKRAAAVMFDAGSGRGTNR